MNERQLTVLVVDDHPVFADALALAIDTSGGLSCAGTAANVDEALAVVDEAKPDVVVMDVHLGDCNGITAAERILHRHPSAKVLMLTGQPVDRSVALSALQVGACGLLPKAARLSVVVDTIRALNPGTFTVDRQLFPLLLGSTPDPDQPPRRPQGGLLTSREQQILELLASGVDAKAAAARLHIRVSTCRGYIKTLLSKLDAHSQLEAVAVARARGLLHDTS